MTTPSVAADYAKGLQAARAALTTLHAEDARLRAEHVALGRERLHLLNAWPPVDEIVAAMRGVVDALAAAWAKNKASSLRAAFGPGLEETTPGSFKPRRSQWPEHLFYSTVYGGFNSEHFAEMSPETVKATFEAALRADPYEAGPPLADRLPLLADVDARIAALERAHEELVDAARALDPPVSFSYFPNVAERRAREAEERRRNELADADRKEREARVNSNHARRPQRSPYLQRQAARRLGG
jgi:hypothetical protein